MKSLDPRIERLPELAVAPQPKGPLDQFGSFEVFVQPKEGKPFQHEGIVHAPDLELAYEFEFIHPFIDGNGRIGRLWQTLLLMQQYPVFEFLPIEHLIKKRQKEYYHALSLSDKKGNSTPTIS